MDQRAFIFATRGQCIKGKLCQHITINNQIFVCIKNNLAYFPFMHCPLVGNQKARWSIGSKFSRRLRTSVTSKKSPNVYKSCPKLIALEQGKIMTPLQKLQKNVGDLGKRILATGFEKLPKVQ